MMLDHPVEATSSRDALDINKPVKSDMTRHQSAVQRACVHSGLQGEACTTAVH